MGKDKAKQIGLLSTEWEDLFRRAAVRVESLDAAKSSRSRSTLIGGFLAKNLDREVPIAVGDRVGKARLRAADVGKRQRRYFFEVTWEGSPPAAERPPAGLDEAATPTTQQRASRHGKSKSMVIPTEPAKHEPAKRTPDRGRRPASSAKRKRNAEDWG